MYTRKRCVQGRDVYNVLQEKGTKLKSTTNMATTDSTLKHPVSLNLIMINQGHDNHQIGCYSERTYVEITSELMINYISYFFLIRLVV